MAFAEIFSSPAFGTKVEKKLATAKGVGLSHTRIVLAPLDGRSRYFALAPLAPNS
jgi:hypothetical protein